METTKNCSLKKPGQDDFYDVQDFDGNMEILDEHIGALESPAYKESKELKELESGEPYLSAFGKIKKAVGALITHIGDKNNPHRVTLAQLGAAAANSLAEHIQDKKNPHGVTKAQVGLGNCDNTADSAKYVAYAASAGNAAAANSAGIANRADSVLSAGYNGQPTQTLRFGRDTAGLYCSLNNVVDEQLGGGHFVFKQASCTNRISFAWNGSGLDLYVDGGRIGTFTLH